MSKYHLLFLLQLFDFINKNLSRPTTTQSKLLKIKGHYKRKNSRILGTITASKMNESVKFVTTDSNRLDKSPNNADKSVLPFLLKTQNPKSHYNNNVLLTCWENHDYAITSESGIWCELKEPVQNENKITEKFKKKNWMYSDKAAAKKLIPISKPHRFKLNQVLVLPDGKFIIVFSLYTPWDTKKKFDTQDHKIPSPNRNILLSQWDVFANKFHNDGNKEAYQNLNTLTDAENKFLEGDQYNASVADQGNNLLAFTWEAYYDETSTNAEKEPKNRETYKGLPPDKNERGKMTSFSLEF